MLERLPLTSPAPIVIELAGVPQGKGRPRFVRSTGHAYTPAKTRHYESDLRLAAQEAMAGRPPLDGPCKVTIEALLGVPASWSGSKQRAALGGLIACTTRPDIDNYLKAALDALIAIVFRDDNQVVEAVIRKLFDERPRLTITVEPA